MGLTTWDRYSQISSAASGGTSNELRHKSVMRQNSSRILTKYDLVKDRNEFWRMTDLCLNSFDVPPEAADEICEYLSQVVRPITEQEAASYYGCSDQLRETM